MYAKPCAMIFLIIQCDSKEDLLYRLLFNFSREMTHAYDEYCRYCNSGSSFVNSKTYGKYISAVNDPHGDIIENDIRNFVYFTIKQEQNAINGQFKTEIDALVDNMKKGRGDDNPLNPDDVWTIIKNTNVWSKLKRCENLRDLVLSETNRTKRDKFIKIFEKYTIKKFHSYGELKMFVRKQFDTFRDHVFRHAGEFAAKILTDEKMNSIPYKWFLPEGRMPKIFI